MFGMTLREQHHQLRCSKRVQGRVCCDGPPGQFAGRETAQAQPKPSAVINQQLYCRSLAVAEYKQSARERILLQLVPAQGSQRVQAFAVLRCTAKPQLCAVHRYAELCESGLCDFQILLHRSQSARNIERCIT